MKTVHDDLKVGDRVSLDPLLYRGELEFIIHSQGELNNILAGNMGNVTLVSRPWYPEAGQVVVAIPVEDGSDFVPEEFIDSLFIDANAKLAGFGWRGLETRQQVIAVLRVLTDRAKR